MKTGKGSLNLYVWEGVMTDYYSASWRMMSGKPVAFSRRRSQLGSPKESSIADLRSTNRLPRSPARAGDEATGLTS